MIDENSVYFSYTDTVRKDPLFAEQVLKVPYYNNVYDAFYKRNPVAQETVTKNANAYLNITQASTYYFQNGELKRGRLLSNEEEKIVQSNEEVDILTRKEKMKSPLNSTSEIWALQRDGVVIAYVSEDDYLNAIHEYDLALKEDPIVREKEVEVILPKISLEQDESKDKLNQDRLTFYHRGLNDGRKGNPAIDSNYDYMEGWNAGYTAYLRDQTIGEVESEKMR